MKVNFKKKSKAELYEAPEGPINVNSVDNLLLNNQLSDIKTKTLTFYFSDYENDDLFGFSCFYTESFSDFLLIERWIEMII